MYRILLSEEGYGRVAARLHRWAGQLDCIRFDKDGQCWVDGEIRSPADAQFDIAWFGPELFALGQDEVFLELVLASSTVQWMQSGRAGFDHPAFAALAARGVTLTMSKGPTPAIGEYVIAQVMDHFQRGPERRAAQRRAEWRPLPFREVAGSRWLLLGFGAIGQETARRARALGAHVTGVRRTPGQNDSLANAVTSPERMGQSLAEADVVVVSTPLTVTTVDSINAAFFASMKAGALFVNVGRGELVVEDDLYDALSTGIVGHAVLDVMRQEPLPADHWIWTHPCVTLTAHTSGLGSNLLQRTDDTLIENLACFFSGQPLSHVITAAQMAESASSA